MALVKEKEKAIKMRLKGCSCSQIKEALGVSKSTLSYWLRDYPLSEDRIRQIRDRNPKRIENFRNTFRKKREARLQTAYQKVAKDIGYLGKRDKFISGFFLYWAEGTKVLNTATSVSNTDPAMIRFFVEWLEMFGIERRQLRARLHLYTDMDKDRETRYWAKEIRLAPSQFRKPYIKKTKLSGVRYSKGGHGHGTCNIIFGNRDLNDYVIMGIKYLQELYE